MCRWSWQGADGLGRTPGAGVVLGEWCRAGVEVEQTQAAAPPPHTKKNRYNTNKRRQKWQDRDIMLLSAERISSCWAKKELTWTECVMWTDAIKQTQRTMMGLSSTSQLSFYYTSQWFQSQEILLQSSAVNKGTSCEKFDNWCLFNNVIIIFLKKGRKKRSCL